MKRVNVRMCFLVVIAAAAMEAYADEQSELVQYRFKSESMIDELVVKLSASVKLYPLSYPKLEGSECFRVERVEKYKEKDDSERLIIVCAPQQNIHQRVTLAYWQTLNTDSLSDLEMRVEATSAVPCSAKRCSNNAHYGATPCANRVIVPYGTICVDAKYPNYQHVCIQMSYQ